MQVSNTLVSFFSACKTELAPKKTSIIFQLFRKSHFSNHTWRPIDDSKPILASWKKPTAEELAGKITLAFLKKLKSHSEKIYSETFYIDSFESQLTAEHIKQALKELGHVAEVKTLRGCNYDPVIISMNNPFYGPR